MPSRELSKLGQSPEKMENNSKKKKDALNASASARSSRASSSTATNVTSRASEDSSLSASQSMSEVVYNSNLVSSSDQDIVGGYDLRAHLQQIMQFSDDMESSSDEYSVESFNDDDGADAELQRIVGREQGEGRGNITPKPTTNQSSNALVPLEEEDEIDSEEENAIMREIKAEITNNVRQEMHSELELYKAKMESMEKEEGQGKEGDNKANADLDHLEPKLKEAFIKMRKLDKVLSKRVRREKEVKRDRILLERRIRQELKELHAEGKQEYKEIETNEQKFLALELPSRHNEGVIVPDEVTGEPVFATQLNEEEYPVLNRNASAGQGTRGARADSKATHKSADEDGSSVHGSSSVASGSVDGTKHRKKRKKDFIKRNKELASDAGNVIAMTEEEKKRLEDLLKDVDNIPDIPEGQEDVEDESNPFQISVCPGEGFHPDQEELRSLTSIDARLKEMLPPQDFESIASSSLSHAPKHKLFTRTAIRSGMDWENHGERALFQNAEQRDMNERLRAIEEELAKLHNPEEIELDTPRLDDDQLHDLIDQCVTSLSRASMSQTSFNTESRYSFADTESIIDGNQSVDGTNENTPRSARQEMFDNPPRLAPEVLQQLLSEAYNPLSKQLSTLKEEDCEDDEGTPIPADVWKLISMEKIEESPDSSDTSKTEKDNKLNTNSRMNHVDEVRKSSSRQNTYDDFQNQSGAKNGFKSLSQNSSSSSLNGANTDTRIDSKPFKLPEIDPTGTLVTQGLNNQRLSNSNQRPGSSNSVKTPINMVRNSFSDSKIDNSQPNSRLEIMSLDGDYMSPRPPSGEKRETGSASKSRTLTPANRPVT